MWPKFPSLFDYRIIINFWERYLTFRPNSLINLYPTIYINYLDHPHYWHFSKVSATLTAAPFPTSNNATIIEKPIETNARYWKTHLHKYLLVAGCVLATFTWFTWLFFLYAMLFFSSISVLLIFFMNWASNVG